MLAGVRARASSAFDFELFARNFDVHAAYIAERCQPESDREQLLIVIDLVQGGDNVRALQEAGTVITKAVEPGMPRFGVAVVPRDGSPVSRYFLEQATPFYTIGLTGSIASTCLRSGQFMNALASCYAHEHAG